MYKSDYLKKTQKGFLKILRFIHFNSKGHNQSDMKICILEKVHSNSDQVRKQREKNFITKFNTKYKGMNRKT